MNEFTASALRFLAENWDHILEGAEGADLIGVNRATLRSRIKAGHALAMRDNEGRERARVEYTPMHLVYNMLFDSLARFGVTPNNDLADTLTVHTDFIFRNVVTGDRNIDAILRATKRDGHVNLSWYDNAEEMEQFTGEPVVVIPIGTMIARFSAKLFAKHDPEAMRKALEA